MPTFHLSLTSFLSAQDVLACALTCVHNYESLGGPDGLIVPHAGKGWPPKRADAVMSFSNASHKFPHANTFYWKVDGDTDDDGVLSCDFSILNYEFQLVLYPHGNEMCTREDHVSLYLVAQQECFVTFELALGSTGKILCHRYVARGDMWGEGTFGPRPHDSDWVVRVSLLEGRVARFRVLPTVDGESAGMTWCIDNMHAKLRWVRQHEENTVWFVSDEMDVYGIVVVAVQLAVCLAPWCVFVKARRGVRIPSLTIELKDDDGHYFCFRMPSHACSLEAAFIGRRGLAFTATSNVRISVRSNALAPLTDEEKNAVETMPLF